MTKKSNRTAHFERKTKETDIKVTLNLDGAGKPGISTGIPFFDHMLGAFAVHGFFDLNIHAVGDLAVDYHHTVEDIGIVLGKVVNDALGGREDITRFGHAVTPMDDALSAVTIDLSNRPFLVYNLSPVVGSKSEFDLVLAKEFFRAFATSGGMNLHINVLYGENEHHILESIFKGTGRALHEAVSIGNRTAGIRSSKGSL